MMPLPPLPTPVATPPPTPKPAAQAKTSCRSSLRPRRSRVVADPVAEAAPPAPPAPEPAPEPRWPLRCRQHRKAGATAAAARRAATSACGCRRKRSTYYTASSANRSSRVPGGPAVHARQWALLRVVGGRGIAALLLPWHLHRRAGRDKSPPRALRPDKFTEERGKLRTSVGRRSSIMTSARCASPTKT